MSEGSEGLDINVARKSRQVGESQLDTFPNREIDSRKCGVARRAVTPPEREARGSNN